DASTQRFNGADVRTPSGGFEMFYKLDFEDHLALHLWRYEQDGTVKGESALQARWLRGSFAAFAWHTLSLALMPVAVVALILSLVNEPASPLIPFVFLAFSVPILVQNLWQRYDPSGAWRRLNRPAAAKRVREALQGDCDNGTLRPNLEVIAQFDDGG